jgi:hypothetical protein
VTDASCDIAFTVSPTPGAAKTGQCTISGAVSGTFVIDTGSLFFNSNHLILDLAGGFEPAGTSTSTCPVSVNSSAPSP